MAPLTVNDARDLVADIDEHLADDARQLAAVKDQAESVHAAYADLMARLRLEIEAAYGGPVNAPGTRHFRG